MVAALDGRGADEAPWEVNDAAPLIAADPEAPAVAVVSDTIEVG